MRGKRTTLCQRWRHFQRKGENAEKEREVEKEVSEVGWWKLKLSYPLICWMWVDQFSGGNSEPEPVLPGSIEEAQPEVGFQSFPQFVQMEIEVYEIIGRGWNPLQPSTRCNWIDTWGPTNTLTGWVMEDSRDSAFKCDISPIMSLTIYRVLCIRGGAGFLLSWLCSL